MSLEKFKEEFWITRHGDLVYTEQNPCGCCPLNFTIESGKGFYQRGSYDFKSRRAFLSFMKSRGRVKL